MAEREPTAEQIAHEDDFVCQVVEYRARVRALVGRPDLRRAAGIGGAWDPETGHAWTTVYLGGGQVLSLDCESEPAFFAAIREAWLERLKWTSAIQRRRQSRDPAAAERYARDLRERDSEYLRLGGTYGGRWSTDLRRADALVGVTAEPEFGGAGESVAAPEALGESAPRRGPPPRVIRPSLRDALRGLVSASNAPPPRARPRWPGWVTA